MIGKELTEVQLDTASPRPYPSLMTKDQTTATLPIGTRVLFEFGTGSPGCWTEYGTVTGYVKETLVIALDETIELPDWLGGGWCCEVERERDEVDVVRAEDGS